LNKDLVDDEDYIIDPIQSVIPNYFSEEFLFRGNESNNIPSVDTVTEAKKMYQQFENKDKSLKSIVDE
jgi:hypothetical protein